MATLRNFYLQLVENGPNSFWDWLVFAGLWLLSCLYGLAVVLRLLLYRFGLKKTYTASVPVISIGNLTVGGTGKTPMADFLAKWMLTRNVPIAIVSRGYGGKYVTDVARVNFPDGTMMKPADCGDEPFLLARRNPSVQVFVARKRVLGVAAAEKAGAKLIILDDGFQHRAVHRDLDIVLLDSQRPFGSGYLLPAGPLREPRSALLRCHLLVLTRFNATVDPKLSLPLPTLKCQHKVAYEVASLSGEMTTLDKLKGKSCVAFAGIARPGAFFASLKSRGLSLSAEISFADHQSYDFDALNRLREACDTCDALITTEKDAVKLVGTEFPVPCYQVGVDLEIQDVTELERLLKKLIAVA